MRDLSAFDGMFEALSAARDEGDMAAAVASAAYGYTRNKLHSPLNAAVFGFFGYKWPLLAASALAVDALFIQEETPLKGFARGRLQDWKDKRTKQYFSEKKSMGLTGVPRWALR